MLSSFAYLTSGDKHIQPLLLSHLADVTIPGKLSLSGGWGVSQWEAPPEEKNTTPPPSSKAITTPVTRTVVDESENFFSAFLSTGEVQTATKTQVVSVPPAKSQRRPQEEKKDEEKQESEAQPAKPITTDSTEQNHTSGESHLIEPGALLETSHSDTVVLEPVPPAILAPTTKSPSQSESSDVKTDAEESKDAVDSKTEESKSQSVQQTEQEATETSCAPAAATQTPPPASTKEVVTESKDSKVEDRQSDTPSPPVSGFSSGTSTTSDIEVLDHESVLSESSASSRQGTGEGKAGLHLMQGSFQLLTASTCGDFPRLDDYSKLMESCGSSSDAFERIDSFSVQSLDSRSVSEVNSDDEIPASRTLASVTVGPASLTESTAVREKPKDEVEEKVGKEEEDEEREKEEEGEEEEEEEISPETMREQSLDEMEESGRSATPVNCEQPEELPEPEDDSKATTLHNPTSESEEPILPITEEMKSFSAVQILELQKVLDLRFDFRSICHRKAVTKTVLTL